MPNNRLKRNNNFFIVEELRPKVIEKLNVKPVTASEAIRNAIDKVHNLRDVGFTGAFGDKKDGKEGSDGKEGKENTKDGKDGKDGKEGSDDKEACDFLFEFGIWEKYPKEVLLKNQGTKVINGSIHNVAEFLKPMM